MKKDFYERIPLQRLCMGISLCCIAVGAQATPANGITEKLLEDTNYPEVSTTTKDLGYSQQRSTKKISGIIKDATGMPIIGANVIVKGTTNGAMTGIDGDFQLEVPANAVLEISYIGYITQTIPVSGKTTFNIVLEEDTQKLDEVVVLGYGAGQRKQDLSASVGVLSNTDDLITRPVSSTEGMLQGQ